MTNSVPVSPVDHFKTIESGSREFHTLAGGVSIRVEEFERWLNGLPGRMEANSSIADPSQNEVALCLRFQRAGKDWAIFYDYFSGHHPDAPDHWQLLRGAPVDVKILALRAFPALLKSIADEQQRRIDALHAATNEFDEFAKTLGIYQKGGA